MAVYFWIEDREGKSGYTFWSSFLENMFPSVILESKENNSKLLKAVMNLTDKENTYIVVYDHSFDNPQVIREGKLLKEQLQSKTNIKELDIICFEYILLEFEKLIEWIYAPEDEFLQKRHKIVIAREKLLEALSKKADYKAITELRNYVETIEEYNIEQLSAKILLELTRNTGFEVQKGKLGSCWIKNCCEWTERSEDDICGLDSSKISEREKMEEIYHFTSLQKELKKCGLEVR